MLAIRSAAVDIPLETLITAPTFMTLPGSASKTVEILLPIASINGKFNKDFWLTARLISTLFAAAMELSITMHAQPFTTAVLQTTQRGRVPPMTAFAFHL